MPHDRQCIPRFQFLAEAFHGSGGFAPIVVWENQQVPLKAPNGQVSYAPRRVPKIAGPCHLVPHPRETPERFASRAALTKYENHLREACERFVSFLGRRHAVREGVDTPLAELLVKNADLRGNNLDVFWSQFALHAKARGSMLLLMDWPVKEGDLPSASLAEQLQRRIVPYLRAVEPELVTGWELSNETGNFSWVEIAVFEDGGDGKGKRHLTRRWDKTNWYLLDEGKPIRQGEHPFGQCPVIPFTESGDVFPHVGKYAQIADLSCSIYNNRSRLEELLAGQTFSLLTFHLPRDGVQQDPATFTATVGVNSMLTYPGERPGFISPDQGNAETYLKVISECQASIRRISHDDASSESTQAESGLSRKLKFERLNADLGSFSHKLQQIELQMWSMFHHALGVQNRVQSTWPTDFNLVDTTTELGILRDMIDTGFPEEVITAKRITVVGGEFDAASEETKASLLAVVREKLHEPNRKDPPGKPS